MDAASVQWLSMLLPQAHYRDPIAMEDPTVWNRISFLFFTWALILLLHLVLGLFSNLLQVVVSYAPGRFEVAM